MWHTRRPAVVKALSEAAAEGDRSENAEYIYRKKELASIDYRIRYLSKRLKELMPVAQKPDDPSKIFFGAWVELEAQDERILRYRIVGPDEFDMEKEYISMDSPVAKAILLHPVAMSLDVKPRLDPHQFRQVEGDDPGVV